MESKERHIAIVKVEKSETGLVITSSKGFRWETDLVDAEVALTNVLANTLVHAYDREKWISERFTVQLIVTRHENE